MRLASSPTKENSLSRSQSRRDVPHKMTRAAQILGATRRILRYRMEKLEIPVNGALQQK